jgi:hypothetical protein
VLFWKPLNVPMKQLNLPALLALGASICCGQTTPAAASAPVVDPTLDNKGLPFYVKMMPEPVAEPWRKITPKERFELYQSYTFSPYAALFAGMGGAIDQGINSPKEWGQGWGAYGDRVASSYGGALVGNTITYGLSAVFRDDNRYVRSHKDGFGGRVGSVLVSPFKAHNDNGEARFSTSQFLGGVGQSTIPLLWAPPSWQGWNNVGVNFAIWYGYTAGLNFAREFYPSVVGFYKRKQTSHSPATTSKP